MHNMTAIKTAFITVPIKNVKAGEKFTPIERMGQPVWLIKKHRWDRKWRISSKSYRMTSKPLHAVDESDADAIFATTDWAIVEREEGGGTYNAHNQRDTSPKTVVADLLAKYGSKNV